MTEQRQWLVIGHDDRPDLLISFWGGMDADPHVCERIDGTRWGPPLPVRALPAFPEQRGGAA